MAAAARSSLSVLLLGVLLACAGALHSLPHPSRLQPLRLRGGGVFSACFSAGAAGERGAPLSVEVVDAPEVEGEGKPRRNAKFPTLISTPFISRPALASASRSLASASAKMRFSSTACSTMIPSLSLSLSALSPSSSQAASNSGDRPPPPKLDLGGALAFTKAQILPIGLLWAILFGLYNPAAGVAFGKLPIVKYAPHGIFFVGGLMLRTSEAKQAVRAYKAILLGVSSILLFTSAIGIQIINLLPLPVRDFSIGAALFVCMPCTIQSGAALSLKAGGNFALSLLITVLCSTGGIFTVPFVLDRIADIGGGIHLPVKAMVFKLMETALLPLVAGKAVASSSKWVKAMVKNYRFYFSLFVTFCVVITPWVQISRSASQGVFKLVSASDVTGIVALLSLTHVVFLGWTFFTSRVLGLTTAMTKSVVFVASSKTLPLALMVLGVLPARIGDKGLIALPCILGHFSQILIDSFLVSAWKKRDEEENDEE